MNYLPRAEVIRVAGAYNDIQELRENLVLIRSADVAEIVRCEECRFMVEDKENKMNKYMPVLICVEKGRNEIVSGKHYCGYGEPRHKED